MRRTCLPSVEPADVYYRLREENWRVKENSAQKERAASGISPFDSPIPQILFSRTGSDLSLERTLFNYL
jgi:hypothetical protein